MSRFLQEVRRVLAELKRRKVFRVAVAYLAASYAGLEGLDLLVRVTDLPIWAPQVFLAMALVGFPVVVAVAWAFEITPEGVRRTDRAAVDPAASEAPRKSLSVTGATVGVVVILFAFAAGGGAWYLMRSGSGPTVEPMGRATVAVLPFTVSGPGVEGLDEGMVNLLSTALDGAGGVRAIDHRTVLAHWDRETGPGSRIDRDASLELARRLGAQWAVLGTVTSMGEEARFTAQIVRSATGEPVGEVLVEGSAGGLLSTVDDLTRTILGVLLERAEGDVPRVSMASLTTSSVTALRTFLAGEQHYRNGRLDSAVVMYRAAAEEDSTFALAHLRHGIAYGWANMTGNLQSAMESAYRHRQQLPERARLAAVAAYLYERRDPRVLDTLQYATAQYRDDPELWSWLGESYFHERACGGLAAADTAFRRAVELDPGFAPYWLHPVQIAIGLHRDRALALERIEAMERGGTAEGGPSEARDPHRHAGIQLVFGDGPAAARADAFLDDVARRQITLAGSADHIYTGHPSMWALRDTLLRTALERDEPALSQGAAAGLVRNSLRVGQIRRALDDAARYGAQDPVLLFPLVRARSIGTPIPDSVIRGRMEGVESSEIPGPWGLVIRLIAALELDGPERVPPGDGVLSRMLEEGVVDSDEGAQARHVIEGYRAWKAGDGGTALELFERVIPPGSFPHAFWRASLYRETGRYEEAVRCYHTEWTEPLAYRGLGEVYAEMGRTDEALEAYRTFLDAWEGADPELQPEVDAVRERVVELSEAPEAAAPTP